MRKFFDMKFIKFILVGVANTLLGLAITFLLYDLLHWGFWWSTAISYILGSILSFFLNKNFTFQNKGSIWITALKFSVNVAICYVLAYSMAQPLVTLLLKNMHLSGAWVDRVAIVFGMGLFTLLNYVGQRFFAFKEKKETK